VSVRGNVLPRPEFIKRIANADVQKGGQAGSLLVWPTANPSVAMEEGEKLKISLRIRPRTPDQPGEIKLGPEAPPFCKLRREQAGDGYWLDFDLEGVRTATYTIPLKVLSIPPKDLRVSLQLNVIPESLVVTPKEIDLGVMSAKDIAAGAVRPARLGVRKQVGTFKIASLSSNLEFLKLDQRTIVDGSNYLIAITVSSHKPIKPASYNGVIRIEIDSGRRTEVPVRVVVTD